MTERGTLRTYLGTAPGVGKTYAMLQEGRHRATAGEKVVVGWLEQHDRAAIGEQLGELEVVEPRTISYRDSSFTDLDVTAIVASGADLVLVDELALHTVGGRERWEGVADLLAAGLDVLTTVNIANLLSVRDFAARITDVGAVESVPDAFVRSGEVVLVDLPAEALRRRIASGAVFSSSQVGGALANYFRVSNLEALSELGRAWMEGNADVVGEDLLVRRGLMAPTAPCLVLAGDSGSEWGERVIRRAAGIARDKDAELVVVHVRARDGYSRRRNQRLAGHDELTAELGGAFVEVPGESPSEALAREARARGASVIVVGRHRSRLGELVHGSISSRLRRLLPDTAVEDVQDEWHPAQQATRSSGQTRLSA